MYLGGAITDLSRTSGIPSWKRGLLQMDNINFVDVIWFGTLMISCMLYHALNLLYPLFERSVILEAWPLCEVNYFTSDGIFAECPGELLHPGYDWFKRDQADIQPNTMCDELMDENEQ